MTTYKCSNCDFTREVKGYVSQHIQKEKCKGAIIIENIVKVKCEVCDKEFNDNKGLNTHKKICMEKKTIKVKEMVNNDELSKSQINMLKMIEQLIKDNEIMKNKIDELEKQVKQLNGKNELETISENGNNDKLCCFAVDYEKIEARNYNNVSTFLDIVENNPIELLAYGGVKMAKERGMLFNDYIELESGDKFYFDKRDKKETKTTSKKLYIFKPIHCLKNSVYEDELGDCYCKEHTRY